MADKEQRIAELEKELKDYAFEILMNEVAIEDARKGIQELVDEGIAKHPVFFEKVQELFSLIESLEETNKNLRNRVLRVEKELESLKS